MSQQLSFEEAPRYHGPDVTAEDAVRFKGAKGRIWAALQSGRWFGLRELARIAGALETSVSIRLREFKGSHDEHLVEKRDCGGGYWEYRLRP